MEFCSTIAHIATITAIAGIIGLIDCIVGGSNLFPSFFVFAPLIQVLVYLEEVKQLHALERDILLEPLLVLLVQT